MRFLRNATVVVVGCTLAWTLPLLAGQGRGAGGQGAGGGGQGGYGAGAPSGGQAGAPRAPKAGAQAGAQPSRPAVNANQRAANLLNTVNAGEMETARLMAGKTQNSQVRDFANKMVQEREQAQNRLQTWAGTSNMTLAQNQTMQRDRQRTRDQLQKDTATQADRAYLRAEIQEHQRAINQLRQLQGQVTDPDLKSYINEQLPALQQNLQEAQQLQTQLSAPSSSGGAQ